MSSAWVTLSVKWLTANRKSNELRYRPWRNLSVQCLIWVSYLLFFRCVSGLMHLCCSSRTTSDIKCVATSRRWRKKWKMLGYARWTRHLKRRSALLSVLSAQPKNGQKFSANRIAVYPPSLNVMKRSYSVVFVFLPLTPPHRRWWEVMFSQVYMFVNNFLAPIQVSLSPNFVTHTLDHRGWGD